MVDIQNNLDNFSSSEGSPQEVSKSENSPKGAKKEILTPKLLLVSMTLLVIISLIFAISNWFDNLRIGFAIRNVNSELLNTNLSLKDSDVANALALQQQDTDLDGLSDYDELYIYKTSPYLSDSDSDGYSDFEEIKNNENPNCPAGQVCGIAMPTSPTPSLLSGFESLTADQIKQLLIEEGGMTEEDIAKIDDETLMVLYQETLQEIEVEGEGFAELQSEQSLDTITPGQLRAVLKTQEGINPEDVDALTDDELMQIWNELLSME